MSGLGLISLSAGVRRSVLVRSSGPSILEIGCGWGALAERLVCRHGCTVVGITLSTEQLTHAKARLTGKVENGRADLSLLDYRDIEGRYDRIVSIEMLEAVGERYWPTYFDKLRACLSDGGIAVLQSLPLTRAAMRHIGAAQTSFSAIFPASKSIKLCCCGCYGVETIGQFCPCALDQFFASERKSTPTKWSRQSDDTSMMNQRQRGTRRMRS